MSLQLHSTDVSLSNTAAAVTILAAPSTTLPLLHQHALQCILAFVTFEELAVSMHLSKSWHAATKSLPALSRLSSTPISKISSLLTAPLLSRHVTSLTLRGKPCHITRMTTAQISNDMPQLTSLECTLLVDSLPISEEETSGYQRWIFPPRLTRLIAHAGDYPGARGEQMQPLIDGFAPLHGLTELLLQLPWKNHTLSFAALSSLSLLTRFTFRWCDWSNMCGDDLIKHLQRCTTLTYLNLFMAMDHMLLRRLLTPIKAAGSNASTVAEPLLFPSLQHLYLGGTVMNKNHYKLLAQLPTLTVLDPSSIQPDAQIVELLHALPLLTSAQLKWTEQSSAGESVSQHFSPSIPCFSTSLLRLEIGRDQLRSAELSRVFACTPNITSLSLCWVPQLESLQCVTQAPFARTLTSFAMNGVGVKTLYVPSISLFGSATLPSLFALDIYFSFRMDAEEELQLKSECMPPNSVRFPRLRTFNYQSATGKVKVRMPMPKQSKIGGIIAESITVVEHAWPYESEEDEDEKE